MRITTVTGDICDQHDVDALVNAWNRNIIPWWLLLPQGVSGALKRRAGTGPFRELGYRPLPLGEARLTSAGALPNQAIIHVAGIDMLWRGSEASIRACVCSAVAMAVEAGFGSLALPVIGAGSGGYDEEEAYALMVDELGRQEADLEVRVVRYRG